MQAMLVQLIESINVYLNKVNESNGMITPDLAGTVVEKRAGKLSRIHYSRFTDGIHPTPKLRRKWARQLLRAMSIIRSMYEPAFANEPFPSESDMEEEYEEA